MVNSCIYSILSGSASANANPHLSNAIPRARDPNPTCCYRQKVINPKPGDQRVAHKIAARNKISARSCNLKLRQTKGKNNMRRNRGRTRQESRGLRAGAGPEQHTNTLYPTAIISLLPENNKVKKGEPWCTYTQRRESGLEFK